MNEQQDWSRFWYKTVGECLKGATTHIHIPIPKTACTTTRKLICPDYYEHYSAEYAIRKIGIKKFKKMFSFSFVRNPYHRLVSYFQYMVNHKYLNTRTFKEWVLSNCIPYQLTEWEGLYAKELPNPLYQRPWISYEGKIIVDFVGRVETFEKDMRYICDKLGTKYEQLISNKSVTKPHREYYDSETIEKASILLKDDIEFFGYKGAAI